MPGYPSTHTTINAAPNAQVAELSHPDNACATPEAACLRDLLIAALQKEGFTVFQTEWWHFDHRNWKEYAILDVEFGRIGDVYKRQSTLCW